MTSSNGRTTHGDIASLLVLGGDWAGLDLSMCMLLQWLNRPCLLRWLRWPWMLEWLRWLWLLRWLSWPCLLRWLRWSWMLKWLVKVGACKDVNPLI